MIAIERGCARACLLVGVLAAASGALKSARAEDAGAAAPAWTFVDPSDVATVAGAPDWVRPAAYRAAVLNHDALRAALAGVPHESNVALAASDRVIALPTPDGTLARYVIVESPVMAPALAAKFPQIKTYLGRGIDDPTASLRMDWTSAGFHAQVLSAHGASYIDPLYRGDDVHYACYYRRDRGRGPQGFECLVDGAHIGASDPSEGIASPAAAVASTGETLRRYRLACACTGEYTQFHGGGVTNGLSAIVTAINRVTGIYEQEASIRLELVANNDQIVYTNGSTDPYTNNNGYTMLGQNQSNLSSVIGNANYDIGHVFSTGGGGIAALQAVCRSTSKAQGVTGLSAPIGDSFYVDYVAHEMGHQFGANHPFNGINGSCCCGNRNGSTAYEPGSGSTIMAYAGICGGDDLQPHSDPYFHAISLYEITNYTQSGYGATCAVTLSTGNTPPVADAGLDYTIPRLTPFELTASATDAENGNLLYCWEEMDLGPGVSLSSPDSGSGPLFRSLSPSTSPTRTFPQSSYILNGTSSLSEKLPVYARALSFRVTVRDQYRGAGGIDWDDARVTIASSGPFEVTGPTSGTVWNGGGEVTWNVSGTDAAPVSAALVDIYLSTDGGQTFPTLLVAGTPNDGSEFVSTGGASTATARIKVIGTGNIFFDYNPADFTIESCAPADPVAGEPEPIAKNRYVSFVPPQGGSESSLRVRFADLPAPFAGFVNDVRWVGPPQTFNDSKGGTFVAAQLQCTPYVADWSTIGLLSIYGDAVVPGATYGIAAESCGGTIAGGGEVMVTTGAWGDIVEPFAGSGSAQPDFTDISSVVEAFQSNPSSPGKARAQLQPNLPDPNFQVDFNDVSAAVGAFLGQAYPYAGPAACP